jgi:hypothetical protein
MNRHRRAAALVRHSGVSSSQSGGAATGRLLFSFLVVALPCFLTVHFALGHSASGQRVESRFTTHEWGTFTSISSPDGATMTWLPLTGSSDLPDFVEHLANTDFKGGLRGTIRMETPVLYFYSPNETTVSVHATFSKGLITEWYPHADVPAVDPRRDYALDEKHTEGAITWNHVSVEPSAAPNFPLDSARDNRYYSARNTSANPVFIDTPSGSQRERFLFYRGVSAIYPPLTATLTADNSVLLQNHFRDTIQAAILFERRGSKLGYRVLGPLAREATIAPPSLDASLDSLDSTVEQLLVSQGLFPDEAQAMLETWKTSWFDDGSRILYVVPRRFVDSVLPLTISPAPAQLTRVFVGRLELITPAIQEAVEAAFATNDTATLAHYGRFLEPILTIMYNSASDQPTRDRMHSYLSRAYEDYYSQFNNPAALTGRQDR